MKKALQGFWRGGLLGGLLGLLGGIVFGLCLILQDLVKFPFQGGTLTPSVSDFDYDLFLMVQSLTTLPGFFFGLLIGAVIGIPLIYLEKQKSWKRIGISALCAALLHFLVVTFFLYYVSQLTFGGIRYYAEYLNYKYLIWPIYSIVAILFGYYFPVFKPRLPKFLRRMVQKTET